MHKKNKLIASTLLISSLFCTSAIAAEVLTNNTGMTLYVFAKDSMNQSNCDGGCAVKWPPYLASDEVKTKENYKTIERSDGSKQSSYNGQPLYTWIGDTKKGDTGGDGLGGVWHTAEKISSSYSY